MVDIFGATGDKGREKLSVIVLRWWNVVLLGSLGARSVEAYEFTWNGALLEDA